MTLNNQGWTAIQDGNALPGQQGMITTLLNGRDTTVINGARWIRARLEGRTAFMNWGEINDRGQIRGLFL